MDNNELENNYLQILDWNRRFVGLVKLLLETQQAYFKSGKDYNLLMKSKAIESQVKKMINPEPKKVKEKDLFDLAQ